MKESGPIGKHILMDYVDYIPPRKEDGDWLLGILRDSVRDSGVIEVHSHVESFDGTKSPTGFASVVLIDESHERSSHSERDRWRLTTLPAVNTIQKLSLK